MNDPTSESSHRESGTPNLASNQSGSNESADRSRPQSMLPLGILALGSAVLYGIIAWLSVAFDYHEPVVDRPIAIVLLMFAATFALYFLSIRFARRASQTRRLMGLIIGAAIVFRIILLFSVPIQEVDIYRYLWDGSVSTQGISPFRFPPAQVLAADRHQSKDQALKNLAKMRDKNPTKAEILRRVHFAELPTIYPPTSQAVFFVAAMSTPKNASVTTSVRVMKAWLIAFDMGVLFLVIGCLRICQLPAGLSIGYAWCPLVLKEIANSGHLDAIAVFLTVLSLFLSARILYRSTNSKQKSKQKRFRRWPALSITALVLAAAVGAKLYPVVLAPLMCLVFARRFGWKSILIPAIVFIVTTWALLLPIMPRPSTDAILLSSAQNQDPNNPSAGSPPTPTDASATGPPVEPRTDPSLGVTKFLKTWEMNDFLFMLVVENLKPTRPNQDAPPVWFSVVPQSARTVVTHQATKRFSMEPYEAPFLITRMVTAFIFIIIALALAWRTAIRPDIAQFCEAAFLTLAWFWLLLPTQNPWYWIWALPLLPFARSQAWIAMSGIVMVYYFRFWFSYHCGNTGVLGTPYQGAAFFDFVITWLEFAPWFAWLAIEFIVRRKKNRK